MRKIVLIYRQRKNKLKMANDPVYLMHIKIYEQIVGYVSVKVSKFMDNNFYSFSVFIFIAAGGGVGVVGEGGGGGSIFSFLICFTAISATFDPGRSFCD